ncbi:MAG: family 20 glycosylhydrolase [Tannerella sp.]|jgi:hexosaminidase|nr:family 20 glycosylhydrolase [Tannerella sp.]
MNKLFFLLSVLTTCLFVSCGDVNTNVSLKTYNEGINIIPMPQSLILNDGSFRPNVKTCFYASGTGAETVASFFAAKIKTSTGNPMNVSDKESSNNVISLLIDKSLDVSEEGYTLDVTPSSVTVKAKTPQGLFYGMQSFMQLLPAEIESHQVERNVAWNVPCVSIKDEPRFGYRGIMLDPCRHFMSVEDVKKHLDVLSLFKINRMHWHLTDDQGWRIEIKQYPKLTETGARRIEGEGFEYGGYYSQEEVKEIIRYASERFITIIPEIELPGHEMAAIAAYPELSCGGETLPPRIIWGVEDIVLCAGKESVFEFFENVFKEVVELFPGEYVHIGGDECPKSEWKKCPLCQKRIREEGLTAIEGHSAEERLQSYFVQRMEKTLAKYGKKIIGWDEILEGGLAPTATVMSWRGEGGGIAAAGMDHDVIMTPQSGGMYLDRYEGDYKTDPVTIGGKATIETVYKYNPTPDTLIKQGKEHFVKGVQCNTWSEYMYTNELWEYRIFPRILALSEVAWTQTDKKDYKDFERRINNAYVRLDAYHINYYIPLPEQPGGSCDFIAFTDKATLEFTTSRPIKVVYTTDGTEPVPESAVYESPLEFTESGILKIRSVLPSGKMSPVRVVTVEKQPFAPAVEPDGKKPGLKMNVTDGMFLKSSEIAANSEWRESAIKDLREITRVVKTDESMRGVNQYAAIASGYVDIPEDGVYYFSSEMEEVWIDGKLLVNNEGEVKRFSRSDRSVALAKGLHGLKAVFLGHIIGGWPSNWNNGSIRIRKADADRFEFVKPEQLFYE